MNTLYWVCLIVGALYSIISLVFGGLLDGLDFDFDFDFDFGALTLPLKPFTIMMFATVFGGAGLVALQLMAPLLTLLVSIPVGLLVAGGLHHLLFVRLRRFEIEAPSEQDAIMQRAQVVESIPADGYGKISFTIDGNTLSGTAREKRPTGGIRKGRNVYIVDYKDNVYYVAEDVEFLPQGPA